MELILHSFSYQIYIAADLTNFTLGRVQLKKTHRKQTSKHSTIKKIYYLFKSLKDSIFGVTNNVAISAILHFLPCSVTYFEGLREKCQEQVHVTLFIAKDLIQIPMPEPAFSRKI